jgi:hypothetical protein
MSEKFTPVNVEGDGQLYLPAHVANEMVQPPFNTFQQEMDAQNEVIGTHGLGSLRNEDSSDRLSEVKAEKLEKSIKDMLKPEHIIDLKAAYDHRLERVKDETRLSVDATRTSDKSEKSRSLADELKNDMIDSYTRVGDKDREVPENVREDISRLMSLSYDELEAMASDNSKSSTDNEAEEQQSDIPSSRVRPSQARKDLSDRTSIDGSENPVVTLEDELQRAQRRMDEAVKAGKFEDYYEAEQGRDAIQNRLAALDSSINPETNPESENSGAEDADVNQNPEETEISESVADDEIDFDSESLPSEADEEAMAERKTTIFTKAKDKLDKLVIAAKTRVGEGWNRTKDYFNDEEKGKRRKIVAGVIGAVAASGVAYLAYKNLYNGDAPNIDNAGDPAADLTPEQIDILNSPEFARMVESGNQIDMANSETVLGVKFDSVQDMYDYFAQNEGSFEKLNEVTKNIKENAMAFAERLESSSPADGRVAPGGGSYRQGS